MGRTRARSVVALAALLVVVLAPAARAEFPADPPDDPEFDVAEEDPTCSTPVTEQQYQLFSFLPACAPLATAPDGASGFSADAAWRDFSIGDPEVMIAYVEGGVNWHEDGDAAGRLDFHEKVYVNPGELPAPTAANGYVDNGDPWFNALDWPDTPDHNGNGILDAEDLIVEFSDGVDDDGNGYVDDISGLGLLRRPERPGGDRRRLHPRQRADARGGGDHEQRPARGRDLPELHAAAGQGRARRRWTAPTTSPRRGCSPPTPAPT